ncbi:MAG TPA: AsmA-like C-terminal region-containing protein [Steroidobacteraceae bacterium]|nr:AsmA-like C-terminal region-containing protein [Steroidobacteraceae bacterium]
MGGTPAEPAVAPAASAATSAEAPRRTSPLRVALVCLLSLLSLAAVVTVTYELAAARVPQHRAALEDLIRHETGLEMRFVELSLRWGWYGPEVVFHGVELGEPGTDAVRLRAARLTVALDTWRMVRSGQLEARRITLQSPDIDLSARVGPDSAPRMAAQDGPDLLSAGTRVLSHWRGGQIDIQGGTLRAAVARGALPVTLNIRRAQLHRLGDRWSADADLLLPEALGAALHLSLQMRGDPATPGLSSGTLGLEGQRLEIAAWRALVPNPQLVRYLPEAGNANLDLHLTFTGGRVSLLAGKIRADALAWGAAGGALPVQRVKGEWQLARRGALWQLSVNAAELGAATDPRGLFTASAPATLTLDVADDAGLRGAAQHVPVAVLAALARFLQPQLPFDAVALGGEARTLTFDWSARRPAGARLVAAADLTDLSVANATGEEVLTGLSAHVSGTDRSFIADLQAPAGYLAVTIAADSAGAASLDARLTLHDADAAVLGHVLGPRTLSTLGAAARLSAGRIESADILWQGPLAAGGARTNAAQFTGTLQLRDAALGAEGDWPDASGIDARVVWRGPHVHAVIDRGQAGGFQLTAATADWNTQGQDAWHFSARARGRAQQALAWLRTHPQVASSWVPGMASIDLRGDTFLDLDVAAPLAASAGRPAGPPRFKATALLEGGELHPLAGLPPIGALRGTLVFADGQLQRSTLSGQWLGGPVSLGLAERRERGAPLLTIAGHGSAAARQAVQAAGGNADQVPLAGSAEWSALLTYVPGADPARDRWQLRADSNLVGLASRLPEPFAKPASALLPLRVELQARGEAGQLRVSLAERLTALAALTRRGDMWRIERAGVRLAGTAPALPAEPVVLLDGRVSRLDVVACLALLRQAATDAALPPVQAHLSAGQLLAGTRSFPEVEVTAETSVGGAGVLQLQGAALSGSASWPASIDAQHPAMVHVARFSMAQLADGASGAGLAVVLAPAVQLFIDDLQWQGHPLGEFGATLASRDDLLEARDAYLSGASGEAHGGARCRGASCSLTFTLDSEDGAGTLAAFGLRPEMSASHASLDGELHWSGAAPEPLATLGGHLHMQLDDGTARSGGTDAAAPPFALLSVPALLAGLSPDDDAETAHVPLRFARVTADYDLRDGNAMTRDLHFDGDAEILLRGRVGLATQDYDQQAWILRGEDRLPSAVRGLGPTPKVAAVWLSLRELFTGAGARARDALRLRGHWDDPIVTPAE